jgi:hypothetical protein
VPVVRTPDGLRAVDKGKPGSPAQIEHYLAGKLKGRLGEARQAMAELAASVGPGELKRSGFRLYDAFRPAVPAGERLNSAAAQRGAAGELDLGKVRAAAAARPQPGRPTDPGERPG